MLAKGIKTFAGYARLKAGKMLETQMLAKGIKTIRDFLFSLDSGHLLETQMLAKGIKTLSRRPSRPALALS